MVISFLARDRTDGRWREVGGSLERNSKGHYLLKKRIWTGARDETLVMGVMGLRGQQPVVLSRRGGWVVVAPRYMPWEQQGEQQGQQGEQQDAEQGQQGKQRDRRRRRLRQLQPEHQRGNLQEGGSEDVGPGQPAGSAGSVPLEPLVFELPPGTPVPQLPHPVSQISLAVGHETRVLEMPGGIPVPHLPRPVSRIPLASRRELVALELPASTVAALFPEEARRGAKEATVWVGHMRAGDPRLTFTGLQLQPAAAAAATAAMQAGGSGGDGPDAWVAAGSALKGLCEVLTAREYGTAVLFMDPGAPALRQADSERPIVRASCLPPRPAEPFIRAGVSHGRQQRAVKESFASSDPAEAARGAAGLARRAAYAAEEQRSRALWLAAMADKGVVDAAQAVARLQRLHPTAQALAKVTEVAEALAGFLVGGGRVAGAGQGAAGQGGVPGAAGEAGGKASGPEEEVDPGTEARLAAGAARKAAEAVLEACGEVADRVTPADWVTMLAWDAVMLFESLVGQDRLSDGGAMAVRAAKRKASTATSRVALARQAAVKGQVAAEEDLDMARAAERAARVYDRMRQRDV